MTTRQLLFSVTASDCDWSFTKGTGAGGQKRNKTSSAVHCTHRASGAAGYSEGSRSQLANRQDAFEKMVGTEKFKLWHRLECMRRSGQMAEVDRVVEQEMKKVRVEVKENGRWVPEQVGA